MIQCQRFRSILSIPLALSVLHLFLVTIVERGVFAAF